MNNKCVFTICAKNYTGLAQILEKSVYRYNSDTDFFIVIADEIDNDTPAFEDNVLIAKEILSIEENVWTNMTFKYDLTEFCTAIKPFSIEYFFNKGYKNVLYMDPDTYLFDSLDYVYKKLETFLFVTAPHITIPEYPYTGDLPDTSFLFNGISNFGFVAIRNNPKSLNIIKWWEDRLTNQCFGEMLRALCVDQKWMDFLPAFLNYDELFFSDNLGLNLAPWNYYERKVVKESDGYYVVSRNGSVNNHDKLVFAHFAGYNYKEFATVGKVSNKARIRLNTLKEYDDINILLDEYVKEVWRNKELFYKYLNLSYTYATFSNGVKIEKMHRRLYNGLVESFDYKKNPFNVVQEDNYYKLLKKKNLINCNRERTNVDSMKPDNINNYEHKLHWIYCLMRILYSVIGYRNYILFLQFVRRLSIYEMNTYILGKQYENYTLK